MSANIKTTIFGAIGALGLYFSTSANATLALIGKVLQGIGTLGAGYFAADSTTAAKS